MAGIVARLWRRGHVLFSDRFIKHENSILPPIYLRRCGTKFHDDSFFLSSGKAEARRLIDQFGVGRDTVMIEVGCGAGRLPIGLIAVGGEVGRYDGVDIDAPAIAWCQRYVTPPHPVYRFHHVLAGHQRYNPRGPRMDDRFRLPLPDQTYDLVYLHSVFSNIEPDDIRIYARQFHRLLKPDGWVFLTAFVEENVPPVTINPTDYHFESSGPLNVARFEKSFFLGLLQDAGLQVRHFAHGVDLDGQSVVHLQSSGWRGNSSLALAAFRPGVPRRDPDRRGK